MVSIYENLYLEGINLNLKAKNKNALLKEMFKSMENSSYIIDKEKAFEDLLDRENIGTTGIGNGVAIPHAKTDAVSNIIISIGILRDEVDYETIDGGKVNIVFMFLTPTKLSKEYLILLAKILRFCQADSFRESLINAKSKEEIVEIIKNTERS